MALRPKQHNQNLLLNHEKELEQINWLHIVIIQKKILKNRKRTVEKITRTRNARFIELPDLVHANDLRVSLMFCNRTLQKIPTIIEYIGLKKHLERVQEEAFLFCYSSP